MENERFPDAVRLTAARYGMDLGRPLVLLSGGPDSVALLRVIQALGGDPVALHVDHGLRDESPEDAEFVRGLCSLLGVRCEVRRLQLEGEANLQERARHERYALAAEVADHLGLRTVATGHTADDVAETVLMNLARGAGLRGLSGIPPVRGRVERPIIERQRREVLSYLAELGQPYLTDPTNVMGKYARNRVRREILPVLEELYPGASRNLARAASLAREDLEGIEALVGRILETRGEEVILPLGALLGWPRAIRRYAVRLAYSTLLPGVPPPGSELVENVLGLVEGGEGTRTLDLPGGVVVAARGREELAFYARPGVEELEEASIRAGETLVFGEWRISASEVARLDPVDAARAEVAYLDVASGPYSVRAVREGDMIRPLGLGGRKKVLRAMMDRKVPSDLRRRTPVVVGRGGEVAWIPLGEVGEGFKVDEKTEKILRLEVARIS